MKGSRKRLLLLNKQSSRPCWLEVKKQGRFAVSKTNLKNAGVFHGGTDTTTRQRHRQKGEREKRG